MASSLRKYPQSQLSGFPKVNLLDLRSRYFTGRCSSNQPVKSIKESSLFNKKSYVASWTVICSRDWSDFGCKPRPYNCHQCDRWLSQVWQFIVTSVSLLPLTFTQQRTCPLVTGHCIDISHVQLH